MDEDVDQIICPVCHVNNLTVNNIFISCPCGVYINTKSRSPKAPAGIPSSEHTEECYHNPIFSMTHNADGPHNLMISCQRAALICELRSGAVERRRQRGLRSGAAGRAGKMAAAAVAEFQRAQSLIGTDRNASIDILHSIVKRDIQESDEEAVRIKEQSIWSSEGCWLRRDRQQEVDLCLECIEWAKAEKRTFLRQALEARLISLYFDTKCYQEALLLGSQLLQELKKMDDKALLVEVQLLESKTYHALSNLPKARAALTSARTTANAIYCPPKLQAALDMQSGVIHAAEEKDWKTAYSYFYEAFEGYDSIDNPRAITALKYMLLCKIMLNTPEEVQGLISGKLALRYAGRQTDSLKCVALASKKRSLADFEKGRSHHQTHLTKLYDNLLEQNLIRVIEPFSRVQISHVSSLIKLSKGDVERKLSQMILDQKFHGILDQGEGVLIVFEEPVVDKTYEAALETIQNMNPESDSPSARRSVSQWDYTQRSLKHEKGQKRPRNIKKQANTTSGYSRSVQESVSTPLLSALSLLSLFPTVFSSLSN
ncbi:hypothetical protein WMY93_003477 [Mugilogobius chulae]|uniref:PCI domain-containing protein n=1 Tax=Mugilogobius chulae TaxID=88201 RepID=A0AAW0PWP2_9GOBI